MRRKKNLQRTINPDPRHGNVLIAKFINHVMRAGKKATAEKVVYKTFDLLEKKYKQDPLVVFDTAMKNVGPTLEIRSRRIGGAAYQIPREVRGDRRETLAFRWILLSARSQKGKPMHEKLADELLAASKNEGAAIKRRQDTHRMAEANRAFAHFGW